MSATSCSSSCWTRGLIEQAEYDEAVSIPLVDTLNIQSVNQGCQSAGNAAFFCSYVTTKILNSEEFGETEADRQKLLNEGGLDIYTTMGRERQQRGHAGGERHDPGLRFLRPGGHDRGHQARHRRGARSSASTARMTPPTRRPATRPRPR